MLEIWGYIQLIAIIIIVGTVIVGIAALLFRAVLSPGKSDANYAPHNFKVERVNGDRIYAKSNQGMSDYELRRLIANTQGIYEVKYQGCGDGSTALEIQTFKGSGEEVAKDLEAVHTVLEMGWRYGEAHERVTGMIYQERHDYKPNRWEKEFDDLVIKQRMANR